LPEEESFEHDGLKLKGKDVALLSYLLAKVKDMLRELLRAKMVRLFSAPYEGKFEGSTLKCWEVKRELKKTPGVFVFDPNTDMEMFALSRFYGADLQGKRWLEIWAELALVVKEMRTQDGNESGIDIFCTKLPEADENYEALWED